ncbi:hypothetical protein GE061_009986 [Apolygus lucorum]|uniref:Peptidase S1 domain-containing protein n=1 Tax=Apolygus lucorum TaxID=248454 RepID=A0A8S9Y336_APOLU|nr:hypothetical protein GE061_009986 [Apolygus lucorum]
MMVINLVTLLLALPYVVNSQMTKGNHENEQLGKLSNASRQAVTRQYYWANGQIAIQNEFPFAATLSWPLQYSPENYEVSTYNPFCGGSIITKFHILTSAQCVDIILKRGYRVNSMVAIIGAFDRRIRTKGEFHIPVRRLDPNPFYFGPPHFINDIALVTLATGIQFHRSVLAICLPKPNYNIDYKTVTAVGWERWKHGSSPFQKKLITSVMSLEVCQVYGPVTTGQLCTYTRAGDFCEEESGGAIVSIKKNMHVLAGVQSGVSCDRRKPVVSTAVDGYVAWLTKVIVETQPLGLPDLCII